MDLWGWVENLEKDLVEAGQPHSARIIADLSNYCADQEVEKVDALLPEAKALCQTLDNPWLSVFVGHWEMRHRLGNKSEGERALADAVALFELAHREETQDCPQSVCVTQDLAACYGLIDGKGWAEERIAVSEETLTQIDPSWACYECLSCEKASALLDQGKPKQALMYLEEVNNTLLKQGDDDNLGVFSNQIDILLALEAYEEVLVRIKDKERAVEKLPYSEWRGIAQSRDLKKVNALSRLGRDKDAFAALPLLKDMNIGDMYTWLTAIYPTLMRHPEDNTWQLGSTLQQALKHLSDNGAHRRVIEMAEMTVRLAVARGARWSAIQQLKLAISHVSKLRIDGGAQATLDELQQLIDDLPVATLPVAADALLEWLNSRHESAKHTPDSQDDIDSEQITSNAVCDDAGSNDTGSNGTGNDKTSSNAKSVPIERNPEQEVEWLLSALEQRPNDADICIQAMNALRACGSPDEGVALMWSFINRQLGNDIAVTKNIINKNTATKMDSCDTDTLDKVDTEEDPLYTFKLEFLDLLIETGNNEDVEHLAQIVRASGDAVFAHWCLVRQAYHNLDWEGVLQHGYDLLELKPDSYSTRILLARSLMQQQRFNDAANEYKYVMDLLPDDNNYIWDYLTAVTAAGDWALMRQTAKTLNMEMAQNEGPPSEDWGWIILRYQEQGDIKEYYGRRTSPVSAIILENAPPNSIQHVGDHVVFDGSILTTPPEDPEERKNYIPTFAVVHTFAYGGYKKSIFIDGVHPGETDLKVFETACEQNGYKLWIYSGSGYEVTDSQASASQNSASQNSSRQNKPENETQDEPQKQGVILPGIMMFLAVPTSVSDKQADAFLTEQTCDWAHQMTWLNLAKAAGVDTKPHEAVIERYGL